MGMRDGERDVDLQLRMQAYLISKGKLRETGEVAEAYTFQNVAVL